MSFQGHVTREQIVALQVGLNGKPFQGENSLIEFPLGIETDDLEAFSAWVNQLKAARDMTGAGRLSYEDAALLAREGARNGNWVQFASAVGQIKDPPVTLRNLLHECTLNFLENGHVEQAKTLADLIEIFSGRGERERRIFEHTQDPLRTRSMLKRDDLTEDDLKHLGLVAVDIEGLREDFLASLKLNQNGLLPLRKPHRAMADILKSCLVDKEKFPVALALYQDSDMDKGVLKSVIEQALYYNRVAFTRENIELGFNYIQDYEPTEPKVTFEWHLFKALALRFLNREDDSLREIQKAKDLANLCSWAHRSHHPLSRIAALDTVKAFEERIRVNRALFSA